MVRIDELKKKALNGEGIGRVEALKLYESRMVSLKRLCSAADEIRRRRCGEVFNMCTIINGKSGRCSEDCKFCAQSSHYQCSIDEYPLLSTDEIVGHAMYNARQGVDRFSIVTSGRRLSHSDTGRVCEAIRAIRSKANIEVCLSLGLVSRKQLEELKAAGAERIHCNLETSRRYFADICTTHTYDEKIATIKTAEEVGLAVCSGGIMGIGEAIEDRIDMAITLRELGVKSIPVNFLSPIPGTPLESMEALRDNEKKRIIAVYRFILPDASIRLAGGRGLIEDKGEGCFKSGANAAITGDMLTTSGITIDNDKKMLSKLGYKLR